MFSIKLKIAAGVLGLGGLLLATPYVEGSSSILNYDGHCLRVLERKQDDSVRTYLGRGTLSNFYFDVGEGPDKFTTKFSLDGYLGDAFNASNKYGQSVLDAKNYCPSILNDDGLLEFVAIDKKIVDKKCNFRLYSRDHFISYVSADEYALDMVIRCDSDAITSGCHMSVFTDSYWSVAISINANKLSFWRDVYAAGQAAIKARLEPLDFCPIEIPFI